MGVLRMAWRNLWRHSRRTLVTIGAMTLALFVLILYTGLLEGYLQNMEGNILDLEVGDVQAHAGDYLNRPSIYTLIEDPEALLDALDDQGYRATARLLGGGLAAAGESSAGASLRGVFVERDARVSKIHEHVSRGEWLDPGDPKGVVLGRRLAQTLDVDTGDELVLLSQATDGSMANDLFTVRGILLGVGDATDRTGVFLTAETFREFFVLTDGQRCGYPISGFMASNVTPTLAPEGEHLFEVCCQCDYEIGDDRKRLNRTIERLEEDLEEMFPGWRDRVIWRKPYFHWEEPARTAGRSGVFRPESKAPGVEGLYLAGDTVASRSLPGLECAADSAMICAREILGELPA